MYKQLLMHTACFLCIEAALSSAPAAEMTEKEAKKIVTALHEKNMKAAGQKNGNKSVDFQSLGFYFTSTHGLLRNILDSMENFNNKATSKGTEILKTANQELAALRALMPQASKDHQENMEQTLSELEFLSGCIQDYPKGVKLAKELMGDYYHMQNEILWPDLVTMLYPDNTLLKGAFANQGFYDYAQEQLISSPDREAKKEAIKVFQRIEKRYGLKSKETLHKGALQAQSVNIEETATALLDRKEQNSQILATDLADQTHKIQARLAARMKKVPAKKGNDAKESLVKTKEQISDQSFPSISEETSESETENLKASDRFDGKKDEAKDRIQRKKALGLLKEMPELPLREGEAKNEASKLIEQSHQDSLQTRTILNEDMKKQKQAIQDRLQDKIAARKNRQKEKSEQMALHKQQSQLKNISFQEKSLMRKRQKELAHLHSLNLKIKRLNADQKTPKKELAVLQKQLETERAEVLRDKNEAERKIYELNRKTGDFDATLFSLHEEINRLSQDLEQLNLERKEERDTLYHVKSQRDELEKEIQQTQKKVSALKNDMSDHDAYMKLRYKEKPADSDTENARAFKQDTTKAIYYSQELEKIDKTLKDLQDALENNDQVLTRAEQSGASKAESLNALLADLHELENKKSNLEIEKEQLEKQKTDLTTPHSKKEAKIKSLDENLSETREKIKTLEADIKAAKLRKSQVEKKSDNLKKDILETQKTKETTRKNIEHKERNLEATKKHHKENIEAQKELRQFNASAEEEHHQLKKRLEPTSDDTPPSPSHEKPEQAQESNFKEDSMESPSLAEELESLGDFSEGEDGSSLNYWSREGEEPKE